MAALATTAIGVSAIGTFDATPDPNGIPLGANGFMLVLAIALLVGFLGYATVEWIQTRHLDSIGRQFDTRTIVLMAFAVPINIVLGQIVASALKLPIYLDSIGTILVGVLAGPIAGAATGLLSSLTWTFVLGGTPLGSPFAWPFAIVAAEIGLVAGLFAYVGAFRHILLALVAGALCGVISALIAAPIAVLVFGGVTGSGTDLLVAMFQQAGADLQTAVLQQALISDPIDKAISFVVVFAILTAVSRRVTARFPQGERALGTVDG